MRPAAVNKVVSATLLVLAVLALSPVVLAGSPDPACVQQCADQWAADKQACLDALNAQLAVIDGKTQDCLNDPANDTPVKQGLCIHNANVQRFAANNDYRKCINRANTTAWNCYRACPPTSRYKP